MDDIDLIELDAHRDAPLAAGWINAPGGPQMLQLMGMLVPNDFKTTVTEEFERSKQIYNNPNEHAWMIEYDGLVVGIIEVHTEIFEGLHAPSISIMIGDATSRGKGIGTVAMQLAIENVIQLGYKTLYARALTRNTASLRLLQKLGFNEDGEPYTDTDKLHWQNMRLNLSV